MASKIHVKVYVLLCKCVPVSRFKIVSNSRCRNDLGHENGIEVMFVVQVLLPHFIQLKGSSEALFIFYFIYLLQGGVTYRYS